MLDVITIRALGGRASGVSFSLRNPLLDLQTTIKASSLFVTKIVPYTGGGDQDRDREREAQQPLRRDLSFTSSLPFTVQPSEGFFTANEDTVS